MKQLDYDYISIRFAKGFKTYDQQAVVQNEMADKLCHLIKTFKPEMRIGKVLELGAGTGLCTRKIYNHFKIDQYIANDIVPDSEKYLRNIISNLEFLPGPAEFLQFPKNVDLIFANAVFQWVEDKAGLVNRIANSLKQGGLFAFSTFGPDNLKEVYEITNNRLPYLTLQEWQDLLHPAFDIKWKEEWTISLRFANAYKVLKHLKATGTNAVKKVKWTKYDLMEFIKRYEKLFSDHNKVTLTYAPIIIVGEKR